MANPSPQLENGYTKIATEIMEALIKYRIPGEQMQCLLFIIRKTYGWNKKEDAIALSQFVDATGINMPNVCRALKGLMDKNIVIKKDNRAIAKYLFNKRYKTWKPLSKKITVIKKDNLPLSKKIDTIDTNTKDNIDYPKWLDVLVWKEFKKMRQKIKKPITVYGEKLAIKKLEKMADNKKARTELINKSILNGWQTFWPSKNTSTSMPRN